MPKFKLKKVNGWPNPHDLTKPQLTALVMDLQGILWGDDDGKPDPDKEWSNDEIEQVADTLSAYGLQP
jgi:hypothetical protein